MKQLFENNTFKILLGINIALFFLAFLFQLITGEFQSFDLEFLSLTGIFSTKLIERGELWTLLTANFVHYDILHFGFNIYALYALGKLVDNFYGYKTLFITYILSGLLASIFTYGYSYVIDEPISSLGASGAIFGLLGLLVSGTLKGNNLPFETKSFYPTLLIAILISLLPQVNLWAHVGGFISGFLLGYFIKPKIGYAFFEKEENLINTLFYISLGIFVIAFFAFVINFFNILLFAEI